MESITLKKGGFKIATLLFAIFFTTSLHAQQKIKDGTVPGSSVLPNSNAILELESANRGLLLPRVSLTATTAAAPLSAHVLGMHVYNTATVGDVTPGAYYNDGTKWVKVAAATAPDWQKVGTATAAINTDDQYIMGAKVGIGTNTPATRLEVNNGTTNGAIKIVDGTQGIDKVLTSDSNGVATWQPSNVHIFNREYGVTQKNTLGTAVRAFFTGTILNITQKENCYDSYVGAVVLVCADKFTILSQDTSVSGFMTPFTGSGTATLTCTTAGANCSTNIVTYTFTIVGGTLTYTCSDEGFNQGVSITGIY